MPAVYVEPLEAHNDARGALLKAMPGPVAGEVYVVSAAPGASRGHHLHRRMAEAFVLVSGEGALSAEDPESGRRWWIPLQGVRVRVEAGVAHALVNTGAVPMVVVAMAERLHDPSDVHPWELPCSP